MNLFLQHRNYEVSIFLEKNEIKGVISGHEDHNFTITEYKNLSWAVDKAIDEIESKESLSKEPAKSDIKDPSTATEAEDDSTSHSSAAYKTEDRRRVTSNTSRAVAKKRREKYRKRTSGGKGKEYVDKIERELSLLRLVENIERGDLGMPLLPEIDFRGMAQKKFEMENTSRKKAEKLVEWLFSAIGYASTSVVILYIVLSSTQ